MKKLTIIIGLFLIVALTSCEKESYCWMCKKDTFYPGAYFSHMIEVCGMTYDERADFERSNTKDDGTVRTTMTCHLKQ